MSQQDNFQNIIQLKTLTITLVGTVFIVGIAYSAGATEVEEGSASVDSVKTLKTQPIDRTFNPKNSIDRPVYSTQELKQITNSFPQKHNQPSFWRRYFDRHEPTEEPFYQIGGGYETDEPSDDPVDNFAIPFIVPSYKIPLVYF